MGSTVWVQGLVKPMRCKDFITGIRPALTGQAAWLWLDMWTLPVLAAGGWFF